MRFLVEFRGKSDSRHLVQGAAPSCVVRVISGCKLSLAVGLLLIACGRKDDGIANREAIGNWELVTWVGYPPEKRLWLKLQSNEFEAIPEPNEIYLDCPTKGYGSLRVNLALPIFLMKEDGTVENQNGVIGNHKNGVVLITFSFPNTDPISIHSPSIRYLTDLTVAHSESDEIIHNLKTAETVRMSIGSWSASSNLNGAVKGIAAMEEYCKTDYSF